MSHAQSRLHATLFMVLALVACDSGLVSTGIDGTGMAKGRDIVSVGRVWGLGSIEVNGVRFAMTGATFTVDGTAANPTDLNLGDIVVIEGTLNSGETSAVAQRVVADHVLQGSIDAVDTAKGSLIALGQTVHVSTDTVYSASLANGIGGLSVGDRINVSGFRNLHGTILATRIDRQAAGGAFKTIGAVTEVATDGRHVSINDLVVDYSGAQWTPAGGRGVLARGDIIEVKGAVTAGTRTLVATSVHVKSDLIGGAAERVAHVEGYLTALDPNNAQRLEVNGLAVSRTGTTTIHGVVSVDAPIAVKGTVDAGGGVVATNVIAPPLQQPAMSYTVQGRVFDAISGPVANPLVDIFVQGPTGGYSYWYAQGGVPLAAAQDGRFTAAAPSNAVMKVYAIKQGYVQPCAVFADSSSPMNLEVELVAESTLDAFNPPPPVSAAGAYTVTGNVYEMTPTGRQPVVGARLWFGDSMGITYATTITDRSGNYIACNLARHPTWLAAWGNELWAQKAGYQDATIWPIDASRSNVIDVEMKRK